MEDFTFKKNEASVALLKSFDGNEEDLMEEFYGTRVSHIVLFEDNAGRILGRNLGEVVSSEVLEDFSNRLKIDIETARGVVILGTGDCPDCGYEIERSEEIKYYPGDYWTAPYTDTISVTEYCPCCGLHETYK